MGCGRGLWTALLWAAMVVLVEEALMTAGAATGTPPSKLWGVVHTGTTTIASGHQTTSPFVLNKCCALDEILNQATSECVPLEKGTLDELKIATVQEKPSWWMDAKIRLAPSRKVQKLLDAAQNATVRHSHRPCRPELTAVTWTGEVSFHRNGSLEMHLLKSAEPGNSEIFLLPPTDFCVDKTLWKGLQLAILACPCKHVVCVRKCCDNKRMLTISEAIAMKQDVHCRTPLPSNYTWNAPLTTLAAGSDRRQANVSYARLRGPFPDACPKDERMNVILEISDKNNAKLFSNGTLAAGVTGSPFHEHQFCVDYGNHNGKEGLFAYVCAQVPKPKPMSWRNYLYVVMYLVGLASLIATLVVYALLRELRRPVYAKALMCHAAALAVALLTLAVSECVSADTYAACATLAFFGQFFLLAAFFWLTVLCFDFSRGLREMLPINSESAGRLLLYYSLFGWGGPIIIVAVTAALNYVRGLPETVQKPEIGMYNCWFSPTWAKFFYYYGPVAFLLLANTIMFTYTMIRLRTYHSEREILKNDSSCLTGGGLRRRRERLLLYAKLFSLMGVTWLLEVAVWAAGAGEITMACVDAVNVLRGVGIFMACCCKRRVLDAVRDRLGDLLPCLAKRHPVDIALSSCTKSTDLSRQTFSTGGIRLNAAESNGNGNEYSPAQEIRSKREVKAEYSAQE